MMQKLVWALTGIFFMAMLLSLSHARYRKSGIGASVKKFKEDAYIFSESTLLLQAAVARLDSLDTSTAVKARQALKVSRLRYKTIESFLEYFFPVAATTYNRPPNIEVEETELEYGMPTGLQVIESLLFAKDVYRQKEELLHQMDLITSSAEDIPSLLYNFNGSDGQLLESLRLELIRITTLDIAGFDAPLLKSGMEESYMALLTVNQSLQPFLETNDRMGDSLAFYMSGALAYLQQHPDFDSFDRLQFITAYALPLQHYLGLFIRSAGMEINSSAALNYDADHLFDARFLNPDAFSDSVSPAGTDMVELGQKLFFEKALSGDGTKSCASCHKPELYFTDGLPKSNAFGAHSFLQRNTPSVLYTAFQYGQGWDGGIKSLEDQIKKVLHSEEEMNAVNDTVIRYLSRKAAYRDGFKKAFPGGEETVTIGHIAQAIAGFLRTAAPFNSPFDRYMRGDRTALSADQKKGFNLFMGKAQCGTCHFAPLFNGLMPPLYAVSDVEVIGVPKTEALDKPAYDEDRGRYDFYPIRFYERAFKTPGLRNIARTAPYMHNGAFTSLRSVILFYNRGGGNGIGLQHEAQTLSSDSLHLTNPEIESIVSFLNSLTDSLTSIQKMMPPS